MEGPEISSTISFQEFQKLDLRVGKIVDAKPVPGAKKLLKLFIDIGGGEVKQGVAGIADLYAPEKLKDKLVAIVVNLEPKKFFGEMSEVMILAATEGNVVSILQPDQAVSAGCKVS